MQPRTTLASVGQELANLPNYETPNYKVALAATAVLALNTFVSSFNCGSFSFWLNALSTAAGAGVTANQYFEGKPLNAVKSAAASTGLFKPAPTKAQPETLADIRDAATPERPATPALR